MARFTHPAIFDGGMSGLLVPHGAFHSSLTQQASAPNITQAVVFENTDFSQGVTVALDSNNHLTKIVLDQGGVYNFQFSAVLHHLGGGGNENNIYMWFRKNGIDIPNSNTKLTVPTNSPYIIAAWNIFITAEPGDYVQLVGFPTNANIILEALPAQTTSPQYPAIPSVIMTVNQIS